MKKNILSLILLVVATINAAAANDVIKISLTNITDYASVSAIDSIYFSADGTQMYILPIGATDAVSFARDDIRSISYIASSDAPTSLKVTYNGSSAKVENPYFLGGVSVSMDGAYVTVNNTNTSSEYTTTLSGTTSDGGFEYNGSYKTTIVLNGVNITSTKGAAINIQDGKRVALEIKKGTENTLVDCANGDQKACLYCKGHLEFDKAGTLNVTGNTKHAISAKEYIELKKSDGTINILGSVGDGIHCKQYFLGKGFSVNMSNIGDDGVVCELDGEENDEGYVDGSVIINAGKYDIKSNVDGIISGTDTLSVKGINAAGNVYLNGGTITINMSGKGGKGIKADGTYSQGLEDGTGPVLTINTTGARVSNPSTTGNNGGNNGGGWPGGGGGGWPGGGGGWGPGGQDSGGSSAKAIKAEGAVTIYGGTTIITTTQEGAEGIESKTSVTIKGGNHYLKCYDDCINSSGIVEFAGGNTVCYSNGNDAVDSNYGKKGAITISGGNVFAYTTTGSPEEGLDCDNNSYIVITGGIAVSAGGSQGGGWGGSSSTSSVGSSTQGYYLGSSPSSFSSSNYYTLCNTSGTPICTFKFEANVNNSLSLFTAPDLGKGKITIKLGTTAPTACTSSISNVAGNEVFFIEPTVTTTRTIANLTAK